MSMLLLALPLVDGQAQSTLYHRSHVIDTTGITLVLLAKDDVQYRLTAVSANGKPLGDTATTYQVDDGTFLAFFKGHWPRMPETQIDSIMTDIRQAVDAPTFKCTANALANYSTSTDLAGGATAALGAVIEWPSGRRFNALLTVSQSRDTVVSIHPLEFSRTILVPGLRRFGLMTIYRELYAIDKGPHGRGLGYGIFFNGASVNWKTFRDTTAAGTERDSVPVHARVTPVTVEAFLSWTLLRDEKARVTLDFGLSGKYLSTSMSDADARLFLGSTQDLFGGPMAGLDVRYGPLHAYVYANYVIQDKNGGIDGLTDLQLHGGISVAATLADTQKKPEQ